MTLPRLTSRQAGDQARMLIVCAERRFREERCDFVLGALVEELRCLAAQYGDALLDGDPEWSDRLEIALLAWSDLAPEPACPHCRSAP